MSCRWSPQIPHGDDECLDCEILSLGGPEGEYGTPYFTDERCVSHQQLHPVDVCNVGFKWDIDGTAGYYCFTHDIWGKDWTVRDVTFDVVQGIAV